MPVLSTLFTKPCLSLDIRTSHDSCSPSKNDFHQLQRLTAILTGQERDSPGLPSSSSSPVKGRVEPMANIQGLHSSPASVQSFSGVMDLFQHDLDTKHLSCPYQGRLTAPLTYDMAVHPKRQKSYFPGSAWMEPQHTLSQTDPILICDSDITVINRALPYDGATWILVVNRSLWMKRISGSIEKRSRIVFNEYRPTYELQITRIRGIDATNIERAQTALVEAIAFNNSGRYLPYGVRSLPPIILHIPICRLDKVLKDEYCFLVREHWKACNPSFMARLRHLFLLQ